MLIVPDFIINHFNNIPTFPQHYNYHQRSFQVKVDPSLSLSHHYRWIVQSQHWSWRNYHSFQDLWIRWFLLHGEPKCGWNKDTRVELHPLAKCSKCLQSHLRTGRMSSSSAAWKSLVTSNGWNSKKPWNINCWQRVLGKILPVEMKRRISWKLFLFLQLILFTRHTKQTSIGVDKIISMHAFLSKKSF